MARESDSRIFVPDAPPASLPRDQAEWILRQLNRLASATNSVREVDDDQDQQFDGHVNDFANPHQVTHAQLSDGTVGHPHVGHVSAGGAQLTLSAPDLAFGNIDGNYRVVDDFDTKETPEVAAVADIGTGLITMQELGFWLFGVTLVFDIVSDSANQTREIALRAYEPTGPTELPVIDQNAIARYAESAVLKGVLRFGIDPLNVNVPLGLAVWSPSGHTIVTNALLTAQYWVARIGHSSVYPP